MPCFENVVSASRALRVGLLALGAVALGEEYEDLIELVEDILDFLESKSTSEPE